MNKIRRFFSSVKLTIVLLLSLAGTSIIGTLIPQLGKRAAYIEKYGETLYRVFDVLNIFDMYHSWWFRMLLVGLTANIIVCSIERLNPTLKLVLKKPLSFKLSRFRKQANAQTFWMKAQPEALKPNFLLTAAKGQGYHRIETHDEEGFTIFAERWRWSRLGAYGVHIGIVLLIAGGLIGSLFGFEGFVNIAEGDAVGTIGLRNSDKALALDFKIRCDAFSVSFYDTGAPKEYRSALTLLQGEKVLIKKEIIVNDPLRYEGINIFQSSYGTLPPQDIKLSFTSAESGMIYEKKADIGKQLELPEDLGSFVLLGFRRSVSFHGHPIGDAYWGTFSPSQGAPIEVLLPVRFPSFDKMRRGKVFIAVSDQEQRYYTGLQVTYDPGVWVVYSGFVTMIVGCFIAFFMSHQQICIDVRRKGDQSHVMVAGIANKNKLVIDGRVERLIQRLQAG